MDQVLLPNMKDGTVASYYGIWGVSRKAVVSVGRFKQIPNSTRSFSVGNPRRSNTARADTDEEEKKKRGERRGRAA